MRKVSDEELVFLKLKFDIDVVCKIVNNYQYDGIIYIDSVTVDNEQPYVDQVYCDQSNDHDLGDYLLEVFFHEPSSTIYIINDKEPMSILEDVPKSLVSKFEEIRFPERNNERYAERFPNGHKPIEF